ncbi:putative holin [Crenobacter sp. SG2305]|uniref:putative holin n=1 Tax=Crenobacter oryzisoli TaxID=3056844 RepID=UPI0025AB38CE|nr:putative holin [Crenobacter sp. SG2305]MDN0081605.1 putative holin [Crenobacter sp. SG2305]
MAEPVTSSAAAGAVGAVTLLSILSGPQAGVVAAAFAGAVVFVLASSELNLWKKLGYGCASFIGGLVGKRMAADGLTMLTGGLIKVEIEVGALVAAAVVVNLLLLLIERAGRDGGGWLDRLKGGSK